MTSEQAAAKPWPLLTLGMALSRVRCRQPARIERMKHSLSVHGQLTPLVGTTRSQGVELVDGCKRLAAAKMLGWPALQVAMRPLGELGQWATMLLLNHAPSSMTTLEEALMLSELIQTGISQSEVASLLTRHMSVLAKFEGVPSTKFEGRAASWPARPWAWPGARRRDGHEHEV